MTNEHTSLEKYTSHTLFSKGLRKGYVWEVSWRRGQTAKYWPKVLLATIAALLPQGCSKGCLWSGFYLRGQLRLEVNCNSNSNWLELCLELQLTQTVCDTWLYDCLTSTCFLWASCLHRIQPVHRSRWYSDIFDRMHMFLDWRLGRRSICYSIIMYCCLERVSFRMFVAWNIYTIVCAFFCYFSVCSYDTTGFIVCRLSLLF